MTAPPVHRPLVPGEVTVDVRLRRADLRKALKDDARSGFAGTPKSMPPVWFYDERGCELYEQITRLDEYYPFRTERELLARWADDIAEMAGASVLVELGSGTGEKTRLLLDGMAASSEGLAGYVAFDVAEATLREAADAVADDLGIAVHAVVGDLRRHLDAVPDVGVPRLFAFLGSTIGNLPPPERHRFLTDVRRVLAPADRFLVATDLVKPVERLLAAYDDAAGVTAEFNRNLLHVLNRELGANFVPERFAHVALWDEPSSWVELRLRATEDMRVAIPGVDMTVTFAAGEDLHTEISTKFRTDQVAAELDEAGMAVIDRWVDPHGDYLLTLARPVAT